MKNPQILSIRALLSVAALAAGGLAFVPAQAQLLGGNAAGGLGGTLGPRQLDVTGQLGAQGQLPRGEKLRDAAGKTAGKAAGQATAQAGAGASVAAEKAAQTQGAAVDKTLQTQATASGMASAAAQTGGAIAVEKAATVRQTATEAKKDGAAQASGSAAVGGSASVQREERGVNASASGQATVGR